MTPESESVHKWRLSQTESDRAGGAARRVVPLSRVGFSQSGSESSELPRIGATIVSTVVAPLGTDLAQSC
jgi:hypothetical protein